MRFRIARKAAMLFVVLIAAALASGDAPTAAQQRPLPNPVLVFQGQEVFETGGKSFIRYRYSVDNLSAYPNELFAAAPDLPPCGKNTKSARTWVDIYDQSGKRLYGFCALGKNTDLDGIWFALEENVLPPSWVYIELNDRKTNTKYKSNLADSTL